MTDTQFPARAWPDMCAAYRDPALSRACLALQEAFAVDVPLLLMLSLADRAGHGIASNAVAEMAANAADWREAVIVPLRQVRQAMKLAFTAPAETALRDGVKQLELRAEQQHVERLAGALTAATIDTGAARRYLMLCGLTDDAAADFSETFTAAAMAQIASADCE